MSVMSGAHKNKEEKGSDTFSLPRTPWSAGSRKAGFGKTCITASRSTRLLSHLFVNARRIFLASSSTSSSFSGARARVPAKSVVRQWPPWSASAGPATFASLRTCWKRPSRANMHGHVWIETDDLPADVRQPGASPRRSGLPNLPDGKANIDALLARAELNYAEQALKAANGKITEAWELLGYNDRFVFSRRIRRILERYPAVAAECPYVERLFRGTST